MSVRVRVSVRVRARVRVSIRVKVSDAWVIIPHVIQVLCEELSHVSGPTQTSSPEAPSPEPKSPDLALIDVIADRNHHHRLSSWCLHRPDVVTNFQITEAMVQTRLNMSMKCTKENLEMDKWMLGILNQSLAEVLQAFGTVIDPQRPPSVNKYRVSHSEPSERLQTIGWDTMGEFPHSS